RAWLPAPAQLAVEDEPEQEAADEQDDAGERRRADGVPAGAIDGAELAVRLEDAAAEDFGLMDGPLARLLKIAAPLDALLELVLRKDQVIQLLHRLHLLVDAHQLLVPRGLSAQRRLQL